MPESFTTQSDQLASTLRRRIIDGEFAPGRRLLTFQEIQSQFSVSRSVAQLAVSQLKEDGFLRPQTDKGLYVSDHPPYLRRYGAVFPVAMGSPEWSHFDEALIREAQDMEKQSLLCEFDVFAGTAEPGEGASVIERLRKECRRDRLAGLIFMPGAHDVGSCPPFDAETLPKVFVFADERWGNRPIVTVDSSSMIHRGLEWLVQRGRRRVAVLRVCDYGQWWDWPGYFDKAGLEFHPQWVQAVGRYGSPEALQTLIPLLMDYPEDQRPDGLLIVDDNLVDFAAAALVTHGCRLGKDLDIVAHCNWPAPEPVKLPMRRIGYHAGHLLDRCLQAIDARRRGESVPELQRLSALFEDEVEPARNGGYRNA